MNSRNELETERLTHLRVIAELDAELRHATASRAELDELQAEHDTLTRDLRVIESRLLRGRPR